MHNGAAIWLYHFVTDKTASAVLHAHLSAEGTSAKQSRLDSCKTRYFTTYSQETSLWLKKYETDEVVAKTDSDITRSAQPSNIKPC